MKPSSRADLFVELEYGIVSRMDKPWGLERMVTCDNTIFKVITVHEGQRTSLQYHKFKNEVIVILEGEGHIELEGRQLRGPGVVHIWPGMKHRAVGPLLMMELTTEQNEDVVRVEDDYDRAPR